MLVVIFFFLPPGLAKSTEKTKPPPEEILKRLDLLSIIVFLSACLSVNSLLVFWKWHYQRCCTKQIELQNPKTTLLRERALSIQPYLKCIKLSLENAQNYSRLSWKCTLCTFLGDLQEQTPTALLLLFTLDTNKTHLRRNLLTITQENFFVF